MYMTYADVWRPLKARPAFIYDVMMILAGALFVALLAQVAFQLPGGVPITGQTFGVLLVGMVLGSKRGTAALLTYLAQGAIGLPVFANGGAGVATFLGPTGGYLVGFVVAAGLAGYLAERGWDRRVLTTILTMVLGNVVIYLCGVPWLKSILGMEWNVAIAAGLTPFIVGDLLKIGLAVALLPYGWRLIGKIGKK